MKKRWKMILRLLLSGILLSVLFSFADWDQIIATLKDARYQYLLLALIVMTANRFLMSYKWNLLLKAKGISVSWMEATRVYYSSNFLGIFLPATLGIDAIRAYLISRKKYSVSEILSSILVERVLGMLVLLIFVMFGCGLFLVKISGSQFDVNKLMGWTALLGILGLLIFLAPFHSNFSNILDKIIFNRTSKTRWVKFGEKLRKLLEDYRQYRTFKFTLISFVLLTVIDNLTMVAWVYCVTLGLNVHVPIIYILTFIPLITFFSRLPFSVDGFGIQEGGFLYFMALLGHSKSVGLSVGLINHFLALISILPGVLFYALDGNIQKLRKREPEDLYDVEK